MKLSVITVTFNSKKEIHELLSSLQKYLPEDSEIIVVDNHSEDQTIEEVQKFQNVKLIQNSENFGFSKGNNIGVKNSSGEYIFFINPDSEVIEDIFTPLIKYLEDNPDVGLIVPSLENEKGEKQRSITHLPTLTGAIKEYLLGQKNAFSEYTPNTDQPVEVECAYGAAFLTKRQIFEKVGGFDERYFLYYEDIDFCRKLKNAGLKIVYNPKFKLIHLVGKSASTIRKNNLPFGFRTFALFVPFKSTGSQYYQVQSGIVYHGFLNALMIRLFLFFTARK